METVTVQTKIEGPCQFVSSLTCGPKEFTIHDWNTYWLRRQRESVGPSWRYRHVKPATLEKYQFEAHTFIRWLNGLAFANANAPFNKPDLEKSDIILRIVPWDHLHRIQARLEGEDLVLFTLLTATCIQVDEVLALRLDAATYEDDVCLLNLPPSLNFMEGRCVALHHGDEVIAAAQTILRQQSPTREYFFQRPRDPRRRIIARITLRRKVAKWGKWIGRPHLKPEDLRLTFVCYLLARGDVGEHYVAHAMGHRDVNRITAIVRAVLRAKERGVPLGEPQKGSGPLGVGYRPCPACGKKDNPMRAKRCGSCPHVFAETVPSRTTRIVADLADVVRRLEALTGQNPDERAREAMRRMSHDPDDEEDA